MSIKTLNSNNQSQNKTKKLKANAVKNKNMVKPGDLWLLGNHKLLCGDGINPKAINYLLDSKSVEMVFTDSLYLNYINIFDTKMEGEYF